MELQRIEKLRKDEARKEAMQIANEERRAAKAAKKKAEAIERQVAQEEFRQMLVCQIPFMPFFIHFRVDCFVFSPLKCDFIDAFAYVGSVMYLIFEI